MGRVGWLLARDPGRQHGLRSGTTSANADGNTFAPGDGYGQAIRIFEIIGAALTDAGSSLADVVRTRMFVTDIARAAEFTRAHAEVFADVRPACTLVEVSRLMSPDMLIEIEVDAVIRDGR